MQVHVYLCRVCTFSYKTLTGSIVSSGLCLGRFVFYLFYLQYIEYFCYICHIQLFVNVVNECSEK